MSYKAGKHVPLTYYPSIHHSFGIRVLVLALALVIVQVAGGTAHGFRSYLNTFNSTYGTAGTRLDSCVLCHIDPAGGGTRNAYGSDFANASIGNHTFNATLEARDSDGDGFTNIVEINARFFPGDPNDHPATDATPPTVTSTSPTNGATGVATNAPITATFSEAVAPATVTTASFTLSGGVTGTVSLNPAGTIATFTPSAPLASNTTYTATITTAVTDVAGNHLAANFVWSFTTAAVADTTPPTVNSTVPDNNATGVATNAAIIATFSEAILAASVSDNTFFVSDGVDNVAGTFTVNGAVVTFTPSAPLADNTPYTTTLRTGITDLAGNPLGADYTWSFTTGTAAAPPPISLFGRGGGGGGCAMAGSGSGVKGLVGAYGALMLTVLGLGLRSRRRKN